MRNRATTPLNTKVKVRQSWSKYNLFNLSRLTNPNYKTTNYFQQKWKAKSMTRSYHGEQVREGQWTRMFDRRLKSVIPLSARDLAKNDGTLESAGRGMGLDASEGAARKGKEPIPYMNMTYAPLERRLDTAIFRAMFASSARQARQFVVHGAVKVNGKHMRYPGYLLNPGDMFQVEPERVMFATGAPKGVLKAKAAEEGEEGEQEQKEDDAEAAAESAEEDAEDDIDVDRDPRDVLKALQSQAKSILATPKENIGAKRKQDLRAFTKAIRRLLSKSASSSILTDSLEAQFAEIQNQLNIRRVNQEAGTSSLPSAQDPAADKDASAEAATDAAPEDEAAAAAAAANNALSDSEYNELFAALQSMAENPEDESKPYATPWMPRDYMSAFAFIPRYLEVHPSICAAVYLRHPVARPGLGEVPTPFALGTSETAFGWYLRRR